MKDAKVAPVPAEGDAAQKGGSARRDALLEIEQRVQKKWEEAKVYDQDLPTDLTKEKFFGTFPYPYMNGVLHLGHAFTLSKLEFAARYQRLLGKQVLFPFGFHCTGMPICAAADRLKREIATYGNPPIFPEEDEEEQKAAAAAQKAPTKKKKEAKKKSGQSTQWGIMREMGVPEDEIHKFQDALHWLNYFPPIAITDLKRFGLAADFRRTFITTDVNPYYDSFIRWQFNTLKKASKVLFGKRLSIFSPIEQQPCADHDRSTGEGVGPQEYTLIKLALLEPFPKELEAFNDKKVYLPAATLRPETMYGQTNLFVLPDGEYGVYEINDTDVFVCSERSALNMSYQDLTPEFGKPNKLATIMGERLLGCAVKAPLATYEKVYVLPLMTIKMDKGTGVVTSVPSDAPDDYAALNDLKKKKALRDKFGITEDMVMPFECVPIIDTPGLGTTPAADMCEKMGVQSQNDKVKLEQIKAQVYLEGFYKGKMIIGAHAGKSVQDAKPIIKQELIDQGLALAYAEPESKVMSRSGVECVVAYTDQWYLEYGEENWKAKVEAHLNDTLECFNPQTHKKFQEIVGWLREWACSRSYGLGTKLPWDTQFVVESLSDSTIYMAFYTIVHHLQGGVLDGSVVGPAGIRAELLTDEVWNYIFLKKVHPDYPEGCGIPKETLDKLCGEFEYWYPLDLRVSGKDLIGNHLTMSLYNHAAIWEDQPEKWPRAFWTNGHLMINAEKMSKSTGNFLTIIQAVETYGADATRLALADAGDTMLDANFAPMTANSVILRLTKEEGWVKELQETPSLLSDREADDFMDKAFENEINICIRNAKEAYDTMQYHVAVKNAFFDLSNARDQYRANCTKPLHRGLINRYLEVSLVMLSPIIPHWTQHMWELIGKEGFVMHASWPEAAEEDIEITQKMSYLLQTANHFRSSLKKQMDGRKKYLTKNKLTDEQQYFDVATITIATKYPVWQEAILIKLNELYQSNDKALPSSRDIAGILKDELDYVKKEDGGVDKKKLNKAVAFAAQSAAEVATAGEAALQLSLPFDEMAFLQEHVHFISRDQGITAINVVMQEETDADTDIACPGKPKTIFSSSWGAPPTVTALPSSNTRRVCTYTHARARPHTLTHADALMVVLLRVARTGALHFSLNAVRLLPLPRKGDPAKAARPTSPKEGSKSRRRKRRRLLPPPPPPLLPTP